MKRPRTEREPMTRVHDRLFAKDWSVSDPTSLALHDAMHAMRYDTPTRDQMMLVLEAAEAWCHFGAYELEWATENVVRQLRHVRRTLRAEVAR